MDSSDLRGMPLRNCLNPKRPRPASLTVPRDDRLELIHARSVFKMNAGKRTPLHEILTRRQALVQAGFQVVRNVTNSRLSDNFRTFSTNKLIIGRDRSQEPESTTRVRSSAAVGMALLGESFSRLSKFGQGVLRRTQPGVERTTHKGPLGPWPTRSWSLA